MPPHSISVPTLALLLCAAILPGTAAAAPEEPATSHHIVRQKHAPALYELAYSANQQAVFVACAGGLGDNARLARVLRLDPETLDLQLEIPLQAPGLGIALDDANHRLYVGNATEAAISVIDTRTNQQTHFLALAEKQMMPDGQGGTTLRPPHNLRELVVDSARQRLFAPGIWFEPTGVLYVVETENMTLEKVIPGFGFGASGVTLDVEAGKVYVSNLQGQLFRVDASTLELEQTFEIAADQLLNLEFDHTRRRVLAVDQGGPQVDHVRKHLSGMDYQNRSQGNQVVVINPADGRIEQRILTGTGPVNLLLDTERDLLYVTNRGSGTITIHDASHDYRLLDTLELPDHPNSLALDAASGSVFVTIKNAPAQAGTPPGGAESVARLGEWGRSGR